MSCSGTGARRSLRRSKSLWANGQAWWREPTVSGSARSMASSDPRAVESCKLCGDSMETPPPSPPMVIAPSALDTWCQPGDSPAATLRGVTASLPTTKALGCDLGRAPRLTVVAPSQACLTCLRVDTHRSHPDVRAMLQGLGTEPVPWGGSAADVSAADLFNLYRDLRP